MMSRWPVSLIVQRKRASLVKTPEHCVRQFIGAHSSWETRANARVNQLQPGTLEYQSAVAEAEAEYVELISKLCATSVIRQNISFGDDLMHSASRESVESIVESAGDAVVRTRHVGLHGFTSEYEYRLVRLEGEWRIASLLYVDAEGAYECL